MQHGQPKVHHGSTNQLISHTRLEIDTMCRLQMVSLVKTCVAMFTSTGEQRPKVGPACEQ
eukprot:4992961-Amphidinium_carterae.1